MSYEFLSSSAHMSFAFKSVRQPCRVSGVAQEKKRRDGAGAVSSGEVAWPHSSFSPIPGFGSVKKEAMRRPRMTGSSMTKLGCSARSVDPREMLASRRSKELHPASSQ